MEIDSTTEKILLSVVFIPGWNEFVMNLKDSHETALQPLLYGVEGVSSGQALYRTGPIYYTMKLSRTVFKYSLRYCKSQENSIKSNNMAFNLSRQDYDSVWNI